MNSSLLLQQQCKSIDKIGGLGESVKHFFASSPNKVSVRTRRRRMSVRFGFLVVLGRRRWHKETLYFLQEHIRIIGFLDDFTQSVHCHLVACLPPLIHAHCNKIQGRGVTFNKNPPGQEADSVAVIKGELSCFYAFIRFPFSSYVKSQPQILPGSMSSKFFQYSRLSNVRELVSRSGIRSTIRINFVILVFHCCIFFTLRSTHPS